MVETEIEEKRENKNKKENVAYIELTIHWPHASSYHGEDVETSNAFMEDNWSLDGPACTA
jgi:hypothetical protein